MNVLPTLLELQDKLVKDLGILHILYLLRIRRAQEFGIPWVRVLGKDDEKDRKNNLEMVAESVIEKELVKKLSKVGGNTHWHIALELVLKEYGMLRNSIHEAILMSTTRLVAILCVPGQNRVQTLRSAVIHLQWKYDLLLTRLFLWLTSLEDPVNRLLQLFVRWLIRLYTIEDASRGGFRNLLLDGWWLEFWEIILLAAGDVERNPGPRQITAEQLAQISHTPIEQDDLFEVFAAVHLVSGLQPSSLDTIKDKHPGDIKQCFFEGLECWLKRNYNTEKHGLPSWRNLVRAIDHPAGGNNHALAMRIVKEHKDSDPVQGEAASTQPSVTDPVAKVDPKRQKIFIAFAKMCRSVTRLLSRSLDVDELKGFLHYFCNPHSPRQLCVDPSIYKGATSTKDVLKSLCPKYINPDELFVLEGIIEMSGSRPCKRLLTVYKNDYC